MNGSGGLTALEAVLDHGVPVAVQAHDFPDIDALGAAWALASLLSSRGFVATPVYRGELRSRSLCNTVRELGLPVGEVPTDTKGPVDIIAIDCAPENGNVSLVRGRLAAIVDHHVPASNPMAPFVDIRMDSGSSSSIVVDYWRESGLEPERRLATALLAGLQADTDFLARGAGPLDIEAFHWLAARADRDLAARLVKTALAPGDLRRIEAALASSLVAERAFFAFVPDALNQESLSILADFVLRVEDVEVALVAERDEEGIRLSIRSRDGAVPAFDLARAVLAGIGSGGGHQRSAGGRIPTSTDPGDAALSSRFFAALAHLRAT